MKKVIGGIILIALIFSLGNVGLSMAQTEPEPTIPGFVEGTGTHFEVTDSEYLNITLDSSEIITVVIHSVPETHLYITATSGATTTQMTLGGLAANTTYYLGEAENHSVGFTSDAAGSYTWTQDLTPPLLVMVLPQPSTKFISDDATGGDCTSIGTWDDANSICTLTQNVNESISIRSNDITLDGNGFSMTGTGSGSGVIVVRRDGVTLKNLNISNFSIGIHLFFPMIIP